MKKHLLFFSLLIAGFGFAQTPCTGTPNPIFVAPASVTICLNSSTSLSLNPFPSGAGYTYQWQSSTISALGPFSNISGANGSALTTPTLNTNTWFVVIITCSNAGTSGTAGPAQVVVTTCTGLNALQGDEGLTVYPVPASGLMTVERSAGDKNAQVRVYAMDGREVLLSTQEFNNGAFTLDVSQLANGMYVIEVLSQLQHSRKLFSVAH